MTQLEMLKQLLGIEGDSKGFVLEFTLAKVEDTIKNHCNIKEIPTELENTVLSMAMELYRIENFGSEEQGSSVKSISVGDTSTTFESSITRDIAKGLLKNYTAQIDPFRQLRW